MDNYEMFHWHAPIDDLSQKLEAFHQNVINTKLFNTVKFMSCLADATNLMGSSDISKFQLVNHLSV